MVKVRDGGRNTPTPSGSTWTASNTWGSDPADRGRQLGVGVRGPEARGVADVLIVCCDDRVQAIEATWPQATVQTCRVHLIRAAMRFVAYGDRKQVAAAFKPTVPGHPAAEAALTRLDAFADSVKYPSAVKSFRDAWERFTPFLAFPPELRRVIYTTNRHRVAELPAAQGHPKPRANDAAAVKLL